MSNMKSLGWILLGTILIGICSADQFENWIPLGEENGPALVFLDESSVPYTSLYTAIVREEQVEIRKIISSRSINVTKMDESVLLVNTSEYPQDRSQWIQAFYLVDLKQGTVALLSRSRSRDKLVHIVCLRTLPGEDRAMLLRYGQGTESNQLLEVNLTNLDVMIRNSFPKDGDFSLFSRPQMQLSPDFRWLATIMPDMEPQEWTGSTDYTLRSLDLETLTFSDLDPNISVMIASISSLAYGTPPFDWISDTQILYQHMPVPELLDPFAMEGTYVLKCVDILTQEISEWTTKQMPMTLDGGSLKMDPFTGDIHFHDYIVDPNTKTLSLYEVPYKIESDVPNKISEITFNGEVIYSGYYGRTSVALSDSQQYFAYFVRPNNKELGTLYVYCDSDETPMKVDDFNDATPIAWLETCEKN